MVEMERQGLNMNPNIVIRRMYIYKEDEDEDDKKYYVMAEQDNGRKRFVTKFRIKDEAVRYLRDYAKKEKWRMNGEEIFRPQGSKAYA